MGKRLRQPPLLGEPDLFLNRTLPTFCVKRLKTPNLNLYGGHVI
jgi:hypothetical protein